MGGGGRGLIGRVPVLPNNVLCKFAVLDVYLHDHVHSVNTASARPVTLGQDALPGRVVADLHRVAKAHSHQA